MSPLISLNKLEKSRILSVGLSISNGKEADALELTNEFVNPKISMRRFVNDTAKSFEENATDIRPFAAANVTSVIAACFRFLLILATTDFRFVRFAIDIDSDFAGPVTLISSSLDKGEIEGMYNSTTAASQSQGLVCNVICGGKSEEKDSCLKSPNINEPGEA